MSNLTHLHDRSTKVKFMLRILKEKKHVVSETYSKIGSESEKNHSGSTFHNTDAY
jgi:hypothetical protein